MTGERAAGPEYEVVERFFKRPRLRTFSEVVDVAVDADDNVYVFTRGVLPIMIFDKNGAFLDGWGDRSDHFFSNPHGITAGLDGFIYTADTGNQVCRKWTVDGKLLLTLGRHNNNAPPHSGTPFNWPTQLTVASNGDLYASDGYFNSHIHCFDPDGTLKFSWGGHGSEPGEFDVVHSVYVDWSDGDKIYASDRYNNRVQIFQSDGTYIGEWGGLEMPNGVRRGNDGLFYIAELGHRVTVRDKDGVVARWGEDAEVDDVVTGGFPLALPTAPSMNPPLRGKVMKEPGAGMFCAPHGIAVDSEGSIYVAEVSESWAGLDRGDRSIQKFVRR